MKLILLKILLLFVAVLLISIPIFSIELGTRIDGKCMTRHCEDQDIIVGKSTGSVDHPKCIYSIEETCQHPLVCERAMCVMPTYPELIIKEPIDGELYSRNVKVRLVFELTKQPEGTHVDSFVDGILSHNIYSPHFFDSIGIGDHTLTVSVVDRDNNVFDDLVKTVKFTISPSNIVGANLFVMPLPTETKDNEIDIKFRTQNVPGLHVDIFLNGELLKHNIASPIKIRLKKGKNDIMLALASSNEELDQTTKNKFSVTYTLDPCKNVVCKTSPNTCYQSEGTCKQGNCTYSFMGKGALCSLRKICDGAGGCNNDREKTKYSTYVANPFSNEKKGKLFIALEKMKNGDWREAYSLDPKWITIPAYSYYDVAKFWNEKTEFKFIESGEYRFFVQFDTTQQYKTFTVK